ncbi:MAG: MFS transporter [Oscillospiraceae bacterium]|nr:MFS transporter [Oscillospiraceae bacterium]
MKFNTKRTMLVGLGFMSICVFWQVYDGIVPLILTNSFGVEGAARGVIMAIDNVLALFLLPFFGSLSDKTHTKLGRRMPYILIGTTGAVCSMLLIPLADRSGSLPFFAVVLGLTLLFMATYRSPTVALMPDVTPKPLRSRGNAIINLMGTIGGIMSLLTISVLVKDEPRPNYLPLFAVTAGFMVLCVILLLCKVRENDFRAEAEKAAEGYEEPETPENKGVDLPRDVKRSLYLMLAAVFFLFMGYNAVSTWFSTYATNVWGMGGGSFALPLTVAQGAALAAYIPVGRLATKIGRRRTILCGCLLLGSMFGLCILFRVFTPVIFLFFVLAGAGYAAIIVNNFPMIWEMCRGADVGRFTGYYYTMSMSAQILTPIVSSALMSAVGDWVLFPYACVFILLSFVCMLFVRHGDIK